MVTLDTVDTSHDIPREKKSQDYATRQKETLLNHPSHKNNAQATATVTAARTDLTNVDVSDAEYKWKDERSKPNTEPLYILH